MSLSSDLISQFVKSTKDTTETKAETTVYGKTVEYDGRMFVQIDGSDLLTPISTTVDVKAEERVTVMIKDHTATITGNITSPAARTDDVKEIGNKITEFEILIGDKVTTRQLEAEIARIDTLVSENVTIKEKLTANEAAIGTLQVTDATITGKLEANEASIKQIETDKIDAAIVESVYAKIESLDATNANLYNLESTYGEFQELTTKNFEAVNADINNLETNTLTVEQAEVKFANIDFSNIGDAAVEKLFAESGIIEDLIMSDGAVTGELVGVTIKGDLIEANTLKADRLVVKGKDGLYYKLNIDGGALTSEDVTVEDLQNGLSGSVIIARSITAEKVAVDDLVAFNATIGGFHITDNSIYSGVKESVDNTTTGVYMDKDGQFAIGDSSNYLKYFKDTDGNWKLDISAARIFMGGSTKTVEEAIDEAQGKAEEAGESAAGNTELIKTAQLNIDAINGVISNLVTDENGSSLMTQTSDGWTFNIGLVNKALDDSQKALLKLQNKDQNTDAMLGELRALINDINNRTAYIDMKEDEQGDPYLELGRRNDESGFKVRITNSAIVFSLGTLNPIRLENKEGVGYVIADNLIVENEFVQGGFAWIIHGSGNLGLVWKGE